MSRAGLGLTLAGQRPSHLLGHQPEPVAAVSLSDLLAAVLGLGGGTAEMASLPDVTPEGLVGFGLGELPRSCGVGQSRASLPRLRSPRPLRPGGSTSLGPFSGDGAPPPFLLLLPLPLPEAPSLEASSSAQAGASAFEFWGASCSVALVLVLGTEFSLLLSVRALSLWAGGSSRPKEDRDKTQKRILTEPSGKQVGSGGWGS